MSRFLAPTGALILTKCYYTDLATFLIFTQLIESIYDLNIYDLNIHEKLKDTILGEQWSSAVRHWH